MGKGRLNLIRTKSLCEEEEQVEKGNIVLETDNGSAKTRRPEN
jgi:hypothetical protein